jgi:hypothetical protein
VSQRLVLHVGLMKSGTSYLQQRLLHSKGSLGRHDFAFPGNGWRDQVMAVTEVLGRRRRPPRSHEGAWDELVADVRGFSGTSLVSMEFLAAPRVARLQVVAEAFAPVPVEVVVTARDLGRTLPAMWQETVKNGQSWALGDYVEAVHEEVGAGATFWREQALAAVLIRWSDVVGPENVTLVTVPPPGADRELLWRRFCQATGLPPEAAGPIDPVNESLGAASVNVLRAVNQELQAYDVPWSDYSDVVKFGLGKKLLTRHRESEPHIGFEVPPWLRERSRLIRERIAAMPVRVVGDLGDLEPLDVPGVDPDSLPDREVRAAALRTLTELVRRQLEGRGGPLVPKDDPTSEGRA